MGMRDNITIDKFPAQGTFKDKRVLVCFHYNTERTIEGTIVRDDAEKPWRTIIALDDGRYVEAVECMYSLLEKELEQ